MIAPEDPAMFSHVTLGTNDFARAEKFYDAVMAALGHPVLFKTSNMFAYGDLAGEKLFILPPFDGKEARPGNGVHAAFKVDSRATVDAFYRAAMDNGGSDEGPPGLRPHYHPNYYGAYVRDPDGNKIQAVCHRKNG
jgi:catechol 2,3-dioxygenase-like lactoylglutathione lyase family enzyme